MLKNLKKYIEHITSNIFEFIALDDQPNVCLFFFFTSSDPHKGSQLCFDVCEHLKADNFLSAADGALIMSNSDIFD